MPDYKNISFKSIKTKLSLFLTLSLTLLFSSNLLAQENTNPKDEQVAEQDNLPALKDVVMVGNNWDGTVDIFDPVTFKIIKRLNEVLIV